MTGYKINNNDIDTIYEVFPTAIATTYGVTDSKFTDSNGKFKKSGQPLKTALASSIPTSANTHLGGANTSAKYKVGGTYIDVALKGRRPIGILLATLAVGTHYINRVNGQSWLSTAPNSATGTMLDYNPTCFFIELQGGGGAGGGSSSVYCSAGGGAGGYCYLPYEIAENSSIKLVVGAGGVGTAKERGTNGQRSYLEKDGVVVAYADGGNGGDVNKADGGWFGGGGGGVVNAYGGQGGKKESSAPAIPALTVTIDKPEPTTWTRGGFAGGANDGNSFGGGGGSSHFGQGGHGNSRETPAKATLGAGGAGAGYRSANSSNGGGGGDGLIKIYY
ncbi:MAG: hypothetical protein RR338_00560 [Clostridia bacterium]